jgi:phenylpyruvate tautomerase PptA (4-oxalocrotonate tautomerase family)
MPVQIIATEGVIPVSEEEALFSGVTKAFLKAHDLVGNNFMTPNIIGEFSIVPKGRTFSGGKRADLVIIETKSPSFAFESQEQKQAFTTEVTDLVTKATGGKHPRDRIFVNMVYAVDGSWGIGGRAYTNACLRAACLQAAK